LGIYICSVAKVGKGDRKMRKIVGLIALIALVVIALNCASDIVLEEEFSLKGSYKGWYTVINLENDDTLKQVYTFIFRDTSFNMKIDTANDSLTDDCLCSYYGPYTIEARITLTVLDSRPASEIGMEQCQTCNPEDKPDGGFTPITEGEIMNLTFSDTVYNLLKKIKMWPQ
jgi:hypothetical protein